MVAEKIEPTILILDDESIKWTWKLSELEMFREMWNEGADIRQLKAALKVNDLNIGLLIADQELKGEIQPRRFGLYGD